MTRYRKAIVALLTGIVAWASAVVVSNAEQITAAEYVMLAGVLANAVAVYFTPNSDPAISERG